MYNNNLRIGFPTLLHTLKLPFTLSICLAAINLFGQSIQAEINQIDQAAIFGKNNASGAGLSYGVIGQSFSTVGIGVYAISHGAQSLGVLAEGNRGLLALGDKIGIRATGDSVAITGESLTSTGIGVHGYGYLAGIIGLSTSETGIGVSGQSTNGVGVEGYSGSSASYDFYAAGPGMNYGAASSQRWKTNIRNIDDPLKKITALRGVYYTWDEDHGGQEDIGFIAEEVGEIVPEIVAYEENAIDATGLDYSKMTPLLVEAFNAMQREHETLKAEHQKTLARISRLEKMILAITSSH